MSGFLLTERLTRAGEDADAFLGRTPYPYAKLPGLITEQGFQRLCAELPPLELFDAQFGVARAHGQKSHDRYALQYQRGLDPALGPAWCAFVHELHGARYRDFLRRMLGLGARDRFVLSMHWHFAPNGASVSPHTDARRKIASHIFYFNTPDTWSAEWGGQTLVLDDGGRLSAHARNVDSLKRIAASEVVGNHSFLFKRTDRSWHAVDPIVCPPDRMRKVFIVVVNRLSLQVVWRRVRGKDPDGYPLRARAASADFR